MQKDCEIHKQNVYLDFITICTIVLYPTDDGNYDFVAVHYSINQPIAGVGAGQWGYDVHDKQGT